VLDTVVEHLTEPPTRVFVDSCGSASCPFCRHLVGADVSREQRAGRTPYSTWTKCVRTGVRGTADVTIAEIEANRVGGLMRFMSSTTEREPLLFECLDPNAILHFMAAFARREYRDPVCWSCWS